MELETIEARREHGPTPLSDQPQIQCVLVVEVDVAAAGPKRTQRASAQSTKGTPVGPERPRVEIGVVAVLRELIAEPRQAATEANCGMHLVRNKPDGPC